MRLDRSSDVVREVYIGVIWWMVDVDQYTTVDVRYVGIIIGMQADTDQVHLGFILAVITDQAHLLIGADCDYFSLWSNIINER